ncbi:MAG: hypothetical protein V3S93_04570 [Methyloceanibacter sp.]|jgi:uncharacterized membrane protein
MDFTVGSALRFGWETFKKRPWFFIGTSIVVAFAYIAVSVVGSIIDTVFGGTAEDPTLAASLFNFLCGILVSMGVTAFYLAAHDNPETVTLSALWHPQPFWKFLGTSVLVYLAIGIGFVLLFVPGIIALLFFMFATFIVIDRGLGPIEAMKESMRIGRGYRWPLLGFIALCMLIIVAGVMALFVGLLVAMPVVTLAFTHAYRVLSAQAGAAPAATDARLST